MRRTLVTAVLVAAASTLWSADTTQSSGHFAGSAASEVLRFEAMKPLVATVIDASVAPAAVEVASYALDSSSDVSRARAANAEVALLGTNALAGPSTAVQSAAPDNATPSTSTAGTVTVLETLGVLSASAGTATAHARDVDVAGSVCPPPDDTGARTIATAGATLADASVLPGGSAVDATAASSAADVTLVPAAAGDGLAVRSSARARLASIRLADRYELRIVGEPHLVATATGVAGGASLDYSQPVIDVIELASGESVGRLDASSPELRLDLPGDPILASFATLKLGAPHDAIVLDDGTYARAEVDLLEVWFTDFAGSYEQFDLRIAPLSVSATAPRGGVTACDGGAPALRDPRPHVIVYSGWRTFEHLSVYQGEVTLGELANESGEFTVEFTSNANFLRPEKLRETDVVLWNNTAGNVPWTPEQRALYERWTSCGGGYVGVHSAADGNYDWPAYDEIVGAGFQSHPHVGYWPIIGDATIQVEDQTHAATAPWHGKSSFRMPDELYLFKTNPRDRGVNVLLSLDEESTYPHTRASLNPLGNPLPVPFGGVYPNDQPLAWTKSYGLGRVFYTNLGHNPYTWARADFREHLLNGILWVTGQRPDAGCLGAG